MTGVKNIISEDAMANAFEKSFLRSSSLSDLPKFNDVFREFEAKQGVPDFVATTGKKLNKRLLNVVNLAYKKFGERSLLVLKEMKGGSPRRVETISKKTGLSDTEVQKILTYLTTERIAQSSSSGSFKLYKKYCYTGLDFWAFELKLSNWRRALFQSLQSSAFASYKIVVFPENKKKVIEKNTTVFQRFGIGIIFFDYATDSANVFLRPRQKRPSSDLHYVYAILKSASFHL